ncbi:uncharacterized protein LOC131019601 isoform X3 [Salvia miltiorrhiza]|uniref:uncharacterized protein LOC131019601 isoform X3 n=1 Tax=Salvia miltiorrhiza TaxID=226208 RepID=UPI0025AD9C66|nr:uncharacterized protein LOC131019601 isoform X3 [Salvia miltiorrhiza]
MTGVQKSAVLYHYPCPDGAFGALAAYLYFSHSPAFAPPLFFPNTVYSPIRAENLPLNETDTVYLLDFVGPLGFVEQLSRKVGRVVVLDHHKTALEMLGSGTSSTNGNVTTVIDMDRSGATIAYDYFKEKLLAGDVNNHTNGAVTEFRRVRRLFEYIEDGDLWRWRLPNSKAFSSGLKDLNLEFDATLNPSLFQQAVNADSIQELRSELGNELALKSLKMDLRGIGAVVYRVPELENDSLLKISLRSIGDEDTTPISQKYGGGGHRNASSFKIDNAGFQTWKLSVNNSRLSR